MRAVAAVDSVMGFEADWILRSSCSSSASSSCEPGFRLDQRCVHSDYFLQQLNVPSHWPAYYLLTIHYLHSSPYLLSC